MGAILDVHMALLDAQLRTRPYASDGTELITRGRWQAGDGLEFEDDSVNQRTIITADTSAILAGAEPVRVRQIVTASTDRVVSALTINLNNGWDVTLNLDYAVNVTFSWTALAATRAQAGRIEVITTGAGNVLSWTNTVWPDAVIPVFTAGQMQLLALWVFGTGTLRGQATEGYAS